MIKKLLFLLVTVTCSTFTMNAQNLLTGSNEGFEGLDPNATGNTPYYWWNFYNASTATLTDETTIVHGGSHAGKVTVASSANIYSPQLANGKSLTVVSGHVLTITAWAKSVNGVGQMQATNNGDYNTRVQPAMTVPTTWTQYSGDYTLTGTSFQLWFNLGGNAETFYIDDVTIVDKTLGIEIYNSDYSIDFYPNPVSDNLNVSSDSDVKSFTITDLNGKVVRTVNNVENSKSINLSDLSQGMYILTTDSNKQFKFLKK